MKVNYKYMEHGVTKHAPFKGTLIVGTQWNHQYTDPTIEAYKKFTTGNIAPKDIVDYVVSVKGEGIIFGGLDWSLQIGEMLEVLELLRDANLKFMIDVPCTVDEFERIMGEAIAKSRGHYDELAKNILTEGDNGIFNYLGQLTLSYLARGGEYYIKCGLGEDAKMYVVDCKGVEA